MTCHNHEYLASQVLAEKKKKNAIFFCEVKNISVQHMKRLKFEVVVLFFPSKKKAGGFNPSEKYDRQVKWEIFPK